MEKVDDDDTGPELLPARRPAPSRDALTAPTGHYPVEAVPDVVEVPGDPYAGLSGLVLAAEERAALTSELPGDLFDLLPSGEVFLPQIHYRKLLNRVFGPGAWGLRPLGDWGKQGNTIVREFGLYVRGTFVASAIGEQDYIPGNRRMSWATAAEAAKSNALMRCCKDLGIAAQAWDKRWAAWFQETYGIRVFVPDENAKLDAKWRLKAGKPFEGWMTDAQGHRRWGVVERGPVSKPAAAMPPVATTTDEVKKGDGERPGSGATPARTAPGARPPSSVGDVDQAAAMREEEAETPLERGLKASLVLEPKQIRQLWAAAHAAWPDDPEDPGRCDRELHTLLRRYTFPSVKLVKQVALPALLEALARVEAKRPGPKPAARVVCRSRHR